MKKPIFSFYYQNNPVKSSKDLDEVRSNGTQRTSHLSSCSPKTAKLYYARKDQIQPTKPIIPKLPKPTHHKIVTQPDLNKPQLTFLPQEIQQPKEHKAQPGFFNWKVIGNFCGVSQKRQSMTGCICDSPCRYRLEWTKKVSEKDKLTYSNLRKVKVLQANEVQIGKDIHRTYPNNPTFSKNLKFRQMLKEVLQVYSVYDPELGYVQGINLIAAILLYHIKSVEETFWALVDLLEHEQLRMIYLGNLQQLRVRCKNVDYLLSQKETKLYKHMTKLEVNSICFLDGWLLSLMSKIVPLQQMHLVIESYKSYGWLFIYRLIIGFIKILRDHLIMSQDESQFLMTLNEQNWKDSGIDWMKIISEAKSQINN